MKTSSSRRSGKLPNIHPGTVLKEEFLVPMGISAYRLAKDVGIPQTRVSQLVKGGRRVTADTALRLQVLRHLRQVLAGLTERLRPGGGVDHQGQGVGRDTSGPSGSVKTIAQAEKAVEGMLG